MIETIRQGLKEDGLVVPMSKLCKWLEVPRRTAYYKPTKAPPKVKPELAAPIKAMIEESPSFGYRTVAHLLGMNKNTVQRIFQLKGWQVRKRAIGFRPRIQALPSVAQAPNERWSTDMCRIWAGKDGWATLALVIDCHTRELLGWHLSRSGKACTASSAFGACPDCPFWHAGTRAGTIPAAQRQWLGVHQPQLHGPGARLWPAPGIHHAALSAAERHGRACHPDFEGAMHTPATIRVLAARQPCDWRLDSVLQPQAPTPGASDENPGGCFCISRVT